MMISIQYLARGCGKQRNLIGLVRGGLGRVDLVEILGQRQELPRLDQLATVSVLGGEKVLLVLGLHLVHLGAHPLGLLGRIQQNHSTPVETKPAPKEARAHRVLENALSLEK